jgi:hypothetical protein
MMIDVLTVRPLGGFKLEIEFSDGTIGVRDFDFTTRETGPMAEPLKDSAYFARVFVEDGALTWPNGYDWDPEALYEDMSSTGLLRPREEARHIVYRRGLDQETWHFVTNCSTWPIENYEETGARPASGAICNECRTKAASNLAVFRRAS